MDRIRPVSTRRSCQKGESLLLCFPLFAGESVETCASASPLSRVFCPSKAVSDKKILFLLIDFNIPGYKNTCRYTSSRRRPLPQYSKVSEQVQRYGPLILSKAHSVALPITLLARP